MPIARSIIYEEESDLTCYIKKVKPIFKWTVQRNTSWFIGQLHEDRNVRVYC